jgi:predicted DNA-binding protein YlxM (UPF0122 family)
MDFLIAKTNENPSGRLSYQEFLNILKSSNITDKDDIYDILKDTIILISKLEEKISIFEANEKSRDYRKIIENNMVKNNVINMSNPINISYHPTIEKESNIPVGTIYRDSVNNNIRVKMKEGWKTIKLEE